MNNTITPFFKEQIRHELCTLYPKCQPEADEVIASIASRIMEGGIEHVRDEKFGVEYLIYGHAVFLVNPKILFEGGYKVVKPGMLICAEKTEAVAWLIFMKQRPMRDLQEVAYLETLRGESWVPKLMAHFFCTLANEREMRRTMFHPYYPRGDLERAHLPLDQCLTLVPRLFCILARLQELGLVHRDIKTLNFLLDSQEEIPNLILIDFAFMCPTGNPFPESMLCGNYRGFAPEYADAWRQRSDQLIQERTTPALDVWAAGVMIAALVPYPDLQEFIMPRHIRTTEKLIEYKQGIFQSNTLPPDSSDPHHQLVASMLHPNPKLRPTAQELFALCQTIEFKDVNSSPAKSA